MSVQNSYTMGHWAGSALADLVHSQRQVTLTDVVRGVASFPFWYKDWWLDLYKNDPNHIFVETSLILIIIYIIVSRSVDWNASGEPDKLTEREEEDLLKEWKRHTRAPLAPKTGRIVNPDYAVVHKVDGKTLTVQLNPMSSSSASSGSESTQVMHNTSNGGVGFMTSVLKNDTAAPALRTVLNFGTSDFIGRSTADSSIKKAALKALDKYGCGSCGPRGFYGTVDVHLELERTIADFLGVDDAILYSDGASTVSSTVAAFAKRGDLLVVDEAIYEPLITGVSLSRANVKWFKHNDMDHLRNVLVDAQQADKKFGREINEQRRFIVVEGLYKNTGKIVPLDEVVKLKEEFKYRLILDESHSFGVLGQTGRGVTELYGKKLMHDVEITTIALENAVGSIGGVTVGSEEVVDHQRLSGSGYCFSASSPPFTATAATKSIELLGSQPEVLSKLRENRNYMYAKLEALCHSKLEDVVVVSSDKRSPMIMLQVAQISETKDLDGFAFFGEVVRESLQRGAAFVATGNHVVGVVPPLPTIRICVSCLHTKEDMDKAVTILADSIDSVVSRMHNSA